jgi:hypothetical protein
MSTSAPGTRLLPADWLLAETTRRIEEQHGEFVIDDPATLHAATAAADPARKIVDRARRRPGGLRLQRSVARSLATMRWTVAVLALLGLLAGAAAAGGVETGHGTIALSYALLVLLVLPSLMLLLWLALSLATRRGTASGLIGRAGWQAALALRTAAALTPERHQLGLALAEFGRLRGGVLMALATHTFWAAFMVGAIFWLWLRFLGLRYDFSWETTLLAGQALAPWITAIGAVPQLLPGVDAPSLDQAQAVLDGRSGPGERTLWARYLLGSLLVYGLAPRLLLAALFAWRWRRLRLALDLKRSGFLALATALDAADAQTLGRRGATPPEPEARPERAHATPGPGPAVAMGLELETPASRQALLAPGTEWLGSASDRASREAVRIALEGFRPRPCELIVLCSMARTPDRGSGAWLAELDAIAPLQIRLVETDRLQARGGDVESRLGDWSGLAARFGLAAPERVD